MERGIKVKIKVKVRARKAKERGTKESPKARVNPTSRVAGTPLCQLGKSLRAPRAALTGCVGITGTMAFAPAMKLAGAPSGMISALTVLPLLLKPRLRLRLAPALVPVSNSVDSTPRGTVRLVLSASYATEITTLALKPVTFLLRLLRLPLSLSVSGARASLRLLLRYE